MEKPFIDAEVRKSLQYSTIRRKIAGSNANTSLSFAR